MNTTTEPAATLADTTTTTTTTDDGIIDMDALAPGEPANDIEDGSLTTTDDPKAKDTPDPAAKTEEEAEAEKKKLSGAQRAKLREQRLHDEIAARDRELEELRAKGTATAAKAGDEPKAPQEADFNGDYFAYTRAMAAFEAGKAAREAAQEIFKSREDAETQRRAADQARVRRLDHAERVEAAKEVIEDFDAVMGEMKGVNVRDDVIDEIMGSKNSAVIAYHLAKNPNELEALNRMSPRELAREMGRLEATLKLPEPKKATSAPPPLSQRKGGGANPPSQESVLSNWLDKKYGKDRK